MRGLWDRFHTDGDGTVTAKVTYWATEGGDWKEVATDTVTMPKPAATGE